MRTFHGKPCPEEASVYAVLFGWRDQEAERWEHGRDDGNQKLEVAVESCQVEVVCVQLDSPYGFECDDDHGEVQMQ